MKAIIISSIIALLSACTNKTQKEKDLVAYWSFDDTTSSKTDECTGSGLITLNIGAKQVTGYKGKAMQFDGTAVLQVEYNPLLDDFNKGITVSAWIKKDTSSHWNTVISREIDSTWSEYIGLAVMKNHALFSVDPDGERYINATDDNIVAPDKWMHLAGTYDLDTFKLYVNGKFVKCGICKGPFKFTDRNPLFIGGNSNDKNNSVLDCFKGCIDEVRIYKRALNENEIYSLLSK